MAHSTIRFAASVGVVTASLLTVGPNPAQAVADERGSSSHADSDYGDSGDFSRTNVQQSATQDQASTDPSSTASGSDGSDSGEQIVEQSSGPDGPVALRAQTVSEQPADVNASGATLAAPRRATAAPRAGSDQSAPRVRAVRSPRVVIGNGRSPGVHGPASGSPREILRDSSLQPPVAPASVPPVPAAVEINLPPLPPPLPPVEHIRPVGVDAPTDPLPGLVGLILIPAVGAVLGYRQARAAQSLRESAPTDSIRI